MKKISQLINLILVDQEAKESYERIFGKGSYEMKHKGEENIAIFFTKIFSVILGVGVGMNLLAILILTTLDLV